MLSLFLSVSLPSFMLRTHWKMSVPTLIRNSSTMRSTLGGPPRHPHNPTEVKGSRHPVRRWGWKAVTEVSLPFTRTDRSDITSLWNVTLLPSVKCFVRAHVIEEISIQNSDIEQWWIFNELCCYELRTSRNRTPFRFQRQRRSCQSEFPDLSVIDTIH